MWRGFSFWVENSLQLYCVVREFDRVVESFVALWVFPAFSENSLFFRVFVDKIARKIKNAPLFCEFFLKRVWNF